jgi:hypothetical protein
LAFLPIVFVGCRKRLTSNSQKFNSTLTATPLRWEELDEDITIPGIVAGRFELALK